MPSNQSPLGARPRRFRRSSLLIIGCGDVGLRVARALGRAGPGNATAMNPALRSAPNAAPSAAPNTVSNTATNAADRVSAPLTPAHASRVRVLALTSTPARAPQLRALGITPLLGNLDQPRSLRRLAGLATRVLHLAPPPTEPASLRQDPRTQQLLRALRRRSAPLALVYGSTSAVYGDLKGELASERQPPRATSPRAQRRAHAEALLRWQGRASAMRTSVLRIPGIYAPDRPNGTPRERLAKGLPVLQAPDDVYTNHIHADDLARACIAALYRGRAQRVYNVNDDTQLRMADYFDAAADLLQLPRPPRVSRAQAAVQLSPMQLSFMSESRRMDNTRMKRELRLRLRYPTVREGLPG